MAETIRRRILYTGRVQGVGFRQTTCMISNSHAVTGFVRNLPDGKVEAVVEGEASEVERFGAAIADEMRGYIRDVRVESGQPTGEFSGFAVRY
jgi:acylphosphatase